MPTTEQRGFVPTDEMRQKIAASLREAGLDDEDFRIEDGYGVHLFGHSANDKVILAAVELVVAYQLHIRVLYGWSKEHPSRKVVALYWADDYFTRGIRYVDTRVR